MKAITIRGVDPETAGRLKRTAAQQGKSANQLTLDILRDVLGLTKEKKFTREYDDLDDLFGRWSNDEFEEIHAKISGERRIDRDLWQ